MSLFDQQPTSDEADRPIEFEFMSPSEWLDFNCELYDVVSELGLDVVDIEPGVVIMSDGTTIGLLQIAQHCHARDRDAWHALIGSHLATMITHMAPDDGVPPLPLSSFDLRIRLIPDDPADSKTHARIGVRPFAEGVLQMLAVDVPGAIRSVREQEITERGWDLDEAWASAWVQTEMLEQPDEVNIIDVGDAEIVHVFSQRPFTAGLIRNLDEVIAQSPEHGSIVSMPLGHSLLVHPIEDGTARDAIAAMIPITRRLHRRGPGSLSAHLYWWRNGELTWIPTYLGDDGIEFYPTPELVAALDSVMP